MNYSTNYLRNRQNTLTNRSIDEVERAFQSICQHFGKSWLERSNGEHRLQHLWSRKDALSTNELFTFGHSLRSLETINKRWLHHQVKLVKGKDENNQNGAIFEIIGINSFLCNNQTVIPSNVDQKGYDAEVQFMNSLRWKLSLKTYAKSHHEKEFRQKIESAYKKIFIPLIEKKSLNIQILIVASTYPTTCDWQQLCSSIEETLNLFSGKFIQRQISDCWSISLLPPKSDEGKIFSQTIPSYSLTATVPYHKNEQNNLISKLEDAVSNLKRHTHDSDQNNLFIFIRLHPTASVEILKKWTEEYFKKNSEKSLNGVLFWQPYIAQDIQNQCRIANYFESYSSNVSNKLIHSEIPRIEFPVGTPTDRPPLWSLISDKKKIELRENYVFQKGDHYVVAQPLNNRYVGTLTYQQGIHTHIVYSDNLGNRVFSGIFGEELCLIGG